MDLDKPKQIIVIRRDLKMRRGKEVAQGAHASQLSTMAAAELDTPAYRQWMDRGFAKVCVTVTSEDALLDLARRAHEAGLPYGLITDSGKTEFHGVPTNTALGIGPAYASELHPITGDLPLY
ncbi:MAG: peptidyl-tRNA hydrolase [Cyanobacteria bacterium RYN_339]|nr:peptidyl-tRNA hydrolase [Cyanobacteria bacterium RYN_339]